jgi:hypothetical protein
VSAVSATPEFSAAVDRVDVQPLLTLSTQDHASALFDVGFMIAEADVATQIANATTT